MRSRITILFAALSIMGVTSLTSCKVTDEVVVDVPEQPVELGMEEIFKGALYGGGSENIEEGLVVVNTESQWNAVLKQMSSVNQVSTQISSQKIDFDTHSVLFLFDRVRSTGGYSFEIVTVIDTGSEVHVISSHKAPEGPATDALTQPYHIVKIEKTTKKITHQKPE